MMQMLLLLGCMSGPVADTPEAATERFLQLMKEQRWDAVAEMFHPDEMKRFHGMFVEILETLESTDDEDIEQFAAIFGVESSADLKAKTPNEFFAGLFGTLIGMAGGISFDKLDVLGHVVEGDKVHVVTRVTMSTMGFSMTQMEVVTMTRHEDKWAVMMTGKIEGMVQAMKAQMTR